MFSVTEQGYQIPFHCQFIQFLIYFNITFVQQRYFSQHIKDIAEIYKMQPYVASFLKGTIPVFVLCFVIVTSQSTTECRGKACENMSDKEPAPESEEKFLEGDGTSTALGVYPYQQSGVNSTTRGLNPALQGDVSPAQQPQSPSYQNENPVAPLVPLQQPQSPYYQYQNPFAPGYQYYVPVGTYQYNYQYQYPTNTNNYNYQYSYQGNTQTSSLCSPVPLYCHEMSKTTRYIFDWVYGCHPSHQCVWMGFASYHDCASVCMS
eukprot:TRINITY_DN1491_c1_g1_i11.p2 TRINITY_DN1491_c1_g1~~TRINITY_DN1491_c1_g1_i11.p2  ORF type:complete len:262 (+),score=-2.45 TRINITY_DN1491_c1_g1_i11:21-806(+)